jgi:hypothetical protein
LCPLILFPKVDAKAFLRGKLQVIDEEYQEWIVVLRAVDESLRLIGRDAAGRGRRKGRNPGKDDNNKYNNRWPRGSGGFRMMEWGAGAAPWALRATQIFRHFYFARKGRSNHSDSSNDNANDTHDNILDPSLPAPCSLLVVEPVEHNNYFLRDTVGSLLRNGADWKCEHVHAVFGFLSGKVASETQRQFTREGGSRGLRVGTGVASDTKDTKNANSGNTLHFREEASHLGHLPPMQLSLARELENETHIVQDEDVQNDINVPTSLAPDDLPPQFVTLTKRSIKDPPAPSASFAEMMYAGIAPPLSGNQNGNTESNTQKPAALPPLLQEQKLEQKLEQNLHKDASSSKDFTSTVKEAVSCRKMRDLYGIVDLVDMDIQEAEIHVVPHYMPFFRCCVRRLYIGTHSRGIHESLKRAFMGERIIVNKEGMNLTITKQSSEEDVDHDHNAVDMDDLNVFDNTNVFDNIDVFDIDVDLPYCTMSRVTGMGSVLIRDGVLSVVNKALMGELGLEY